MRTIDTPDNEHADFLVAIGVQAKAALPDASAVISANAGSGKTKVLIDRVARLLLQREDGRPGAQPDSILCITYTKAAASEMLSRLFRTLGAWSVMEDDELRLRLSKLEGRPPESYLDENLKIARALFAQALETPGGLRIETIHAFCSRVLRRFPLEAGVLPGFSEIEEDESNALWAEAADAAILRAAINQSDLLDLLAVEGGHEGAFAGLGKLRYASERVLAFAARYNNSDEEMSEALRFSLNASDLTPEEMIIDAMTTALPRAALKAAAEVLSQSKTKMDLRLADHINEMLVIQDPLKAWECYRGAFFGKSAPYKSLLSKKMQSDASLVSLFSTDDISGTEVARVMALETDMGVARAYQRTRALLIVGIPALKAFRDAKARRAALDFQDLIVKTRDLLTTPGMSEWVLYKLDGGLSHVLLDEAQDTSPMQWELIKALTEEFGAGEGSERAQDPRTLFIVGDEKQSIYSFQGADPSLMRINANEFAIQQPDLIQETMGMSFRSSPEILKFVDEVWNGSPDIEMPFDGVPPHAADNVLHTARRAGQPGTVELWPIAAKQEDDPEDAWERPVNAMRYSSPKAKLANQIAGEVKAMIARGDSVWREQTNGDWARSAMRAEDVLILVRSRTGGFFDAVIGALKSKDVPVAGADRLKLNDHIGVQDCLNLMRFVLLPESDLVLAEILRGPFCGLVDDDAYLYPLGAGRKKGISLWQRVRESDDNAVKAVATFLNEMIDHRHLPAFEFLSRVLDCPCVSGRTGWVAINERLGHPAKDPIEALLSRALSHDADRPASLQVFVAAMDVDDVDIKRDLASPEGEVRVMTVHGAKGLQAPVVILPDTTATPKGTSDTLFTIDGVPVWTPRKVDDVPETLAARELANGKAEEEHRRLLYVALTRAQDRLIIAGSWHGRSGVGGRSWYELCRSAMERLVPEFDADADAVSDGDAESVVYGALPPLADDAAKPDSDAATLPDWVFSPPPVIETGRYFVAPSRLLGHKAPILAPFGPRREARLKRGRLIHALLEYLPELPLEARETAGDQWLSRQGIEDDGARAEMLGAAMGVLLAPEIAHVFGPGSRAEAAIIGTSDRLPPSTIVNGRVDRLVVTDDEVLIIDFKTDQPAATSVDQVAKAYMVQMAAYAAVLQEAWPEKTVTAALCWTDSAKLMVLPSDDLLEVLNSAKSGV